MRNTNPTMTVTMPDGRTMPDRRPGHSVSGLLYYYDPFQRAHNVNACKVAKHIRFSEALA
jgi:hypothetical protein